MPDQLHHHIAGDVQWGHAHLFVVGRPFDDIYPDHLDLHGVEAEVMHVLYAIL